MPDELTDTFQTSLSKSSPAFNAAQFERQFLQLAAWYEGAIEEGIRILLEAKQTLEHDPDHPHTVIRSLSSRLKTPESIYRKMVRFHFPLTLESMQENLQDIAGIRIVCSYIYDIYALRRWLLKQDGLELVIAKDYISNPKPSGYRSLHLIFKVSVQIEDEKRMIPIEMQIRTTAMDSWASLEHQLRYKGSLIEDSDIHQELRDCASLLYESDLRMQKIFVRLSWQDQTESVPENPSDALPDQEEAMTSESSREKN